MAQDSSQSEWKRSCNRSQRRSNKQNLRNEDSEQLTHYKKTRNGDIWASPNDGKNWRRGAGHDKKKPWRD